MKLTADYVFDEINRGLNRALPALIITMFMMIIASMHSDGTDLVWFSAAGSSICFAALSGFLIWGPIDRNRRPFWQILAVIFFALGFLLFIITLFAFYYDTYFN